MTAYTHPSKRAFRVPAWHLTTILSLSAAVAPAVSIAGEAYVGIGLPGVFAGYAHPVSNHFVLRADYATMGQYKKNGNEDGIDYRGNVKVGRLGTFVDYFPWRSGFRLTGGVTFNQTQIELKSNFSTTSLQTVGEETRLVGPGDYFNVRVKFPAVTPFLGIGYGHGPATNSPGWAFHADLGASLGKGKLTLDTNLQSRGFSQESIDSETQELRDGAAKLTLIPQLSIGASYRF